MDSIEAYLKTHLSEKRKAHVRGVVETSAQLAEAYGADVEKAKQAALFHDMFRGAPMDVLNRHVCQLGLDPVYLDNGNLSHGPIAAAVMERDYGIADTDVIQAVRYHTTGRAGMSLLEKVLFLADAIEPGRDYPGVEKLRELARESLDKACLCSMERSIAYIRERGLFLHEDTIKARDDLKRKGEVNGL